MASNNTCATNGDIKSSREEQVTIVPSDDLHTNEKIPSRQLKYKELTRNDIEKILNLDL